MHTMLDPPRSIPTTLNPDLEVAGHVVVQRLPLAATPEGGRRRCRHSVEDRMDLGCDLRRTRTQNRFARRKEPWPHRAGLTKAHVSCANVLTRLPSYSAGGMFWLKRNTLSGSYRFLISRNRVNFSSPYAAWTRSIGSSADM
jgi:hypothetical protein